MNIGFSGCSLFWLIIRVNFGLFLEPAGLPRVLFDDDDDDDGRGVTLLGWTIVKVEKENVSKRKWKSD